MEENKKTKPNYTGKIDCAGWEKIDKNGNKYISVKIGTMYFNLFPYKETVEENVE